jgi:hypothetical protein
MPRTNPAAWIRAGITGLPLYGLLTLWAAREPQPNPAQQYEAWAQFVTTQEYVLSHVLGTILGLVLALLGTIALGAHLASGRTGRLALGATVVATVGLALFLVISGVSAFAAPLEGQAYLAGIEGIADLPASYAGRAMGILGLAAVVLLFVGNVLLGAAVWRSRVLPAWAGAVWIVAAVLMYPLGIVVAAAATGSTPPTVLAGAGLVLVAGTGMAWRAYRPR